MLKSDVLKRVGFTSLGVLAGQLITLIASPLLTRWFGPHELGLFGLFSTAAFLIGSVSSLRYDLAIALASGRAFSAAAFTLSAGITLLVMFFSGMVLLLGGAALISAAVGLPELRGLMWLLPVQVFSTGLFLSANQWATRKRQLKPQAVFQISRAFTVTVLQLAAGVVSLGAMGLVVAQIVGSLCAALLLCWQALSADRAILTHSISIRRCAVVAKRFSALPKFSAPQELVTGIGQSAPSFVLAASYGSTTVGLYWLTVRTMQFPVTFIGQATRQVLLQHIVAQRQSGGSVYRVVIEWTSVIGALALISFSPILLYGPEIFGFVFGAPWIEAGSYARWTAVWMITSLLKVPSWCMFHAFGMQRQQFLFETAALSIQLPIFSALAFAGATPLVAISSLCFVYSTVNVMMVLFALARARKQ